MAGENSPPDNTRCVETTLGVLRYSELIPLLAERVLRVEQSIVQGRWETRSFDWNLACEFHSGICGDLVPEWAGQARRVEVTVGSHAPPRACELPECLTNYFEDATARLAFAREDSSGELLLEYLAFVEGRFLTIHPFQDFNGRVVRLLLQEVCQRLELPVMDLAPQEADRQRYLDALRDGDKMDWRALKEVWKTRLES